MGTNRHKNHSRETHIPDRFNSPPSIILRIGHALALGVLSMGVFWLIFGHTSFDELYTLIVKFLAGATYTALLPSYLLVITGKCKSRRLLKAVSFVTVVITPVALLALYGFTRDLLGTTCTLFFNGVISCLEGALFFPVIIFFMPGIFICVTLLLTGFAISGLIDESRLHPQNKDLGHQPSVKH
jgi:hypothetical protein